jgi:uncharacterized paraquat-inducible protein A
MKQINIDISDNIQGIECDSCDTKFIVSKKTIDSGKTITCPFCSKKENKLLNQSRANK